MFRRFGTAYLQSVLFLLFLFLLHRVLTYEYLADELHRSASIDLLAFAVGAASDLSVTLILACAIALPTALARQHGGAMRVAVHVLVAVALSLHHAYVAYFHQPVSWLHLTYFKDLHFINANASAALSSGGAITLASGLVAAWACSHLTLPRRLHDPLVGLALLAVLPLVWLGQKANHSISYRFFFAKNNILPQPLEFNLLENLVRDDAFGTVRHLSLAPTEQYELLTLLRTRCQGCQSDQATLASTLLQPVGAQPATGFAAKLTRVFRTEVEQGRHPLVLVLLMEGLRFHDTGLANETMSLTPELDALAAGGLVFHRAYSTGIVTRGAQEATLCGHLASQNLSAMRGYRTMRVTCVPEAPDKLPHGQFLWLHGGVAAFDGQGEFWRRHGMTHVLDREAFAAQSEGFWGLTDRAFLEEAAAHLKASRDEAAYTVAMLLTLTNHSPWQVPSDAPESMSGEISSMATCRYSDAALGDFVRALKASALWESTILFVTGDHGHLGPAPSELLGGATPLSRMEKLSHVPLVLMGGLVERAGITPELRAQAREAYVSHMDIAPTLAALLGAESFLTLRRGLFAPSALPLVVDLGQEIAAPEANATTLIKNLAEPLTPGALGAAYGPALAYKGIASHFNTSREEQR